MSVTPPASRVAAHKKYAPPKVSSRCRIPGGAEVHPHSASSGIDELQREDCHMSKSLLKLGVLGASALALTVRSRYHTADADAQDRVVGRCRARSAATLPHLGPSGLRFSKDIERMSGGKFEIKFFEPGAIVPALECFDAVSKGSAEACWTTPGYHTGKYPALAFFTTVPFGPEHRRVPGLEVVRRRQQAARRDLRQARSHRLRLLLHRPGDVGLVPQRDQVAR